ncbi:MAG: hypothetical protein AABX53_00045 [Nanoarchaeota archaeon]
MNKNVFKLLVPLFAIILLSGIASAYYYGDGYKKEYTVKETYDDYGYSYYEKNTDKSPWGEVTTYKKIKDNDGYASPYGNRVGDYWYEGPSGYSRTYRMTNTYGDEWRHMGYAWDDSYQRDRYDTQYTDYYYNPRYFYNGNTYNWEGDEPRCANDRSGRWSSVSYCGNNIYHYSW